MFVAISGDFNEEKRLHMLSPKVMHWHNDMWLMDLSPCQSYWQAYASKVGLTLAEAVRQVVEEECGDADFRAVLADHPWQALLLLAFIKERGLSGFIDRGDHFGSVLYRDISWQSWIDLLERLGELLDELKYKRFRLTNFKRQLLQMRAAVDKLGISSPWELQAVGDYAIRRRYGNTIKEAWQWTFPAATNNLMGFPWVRYQMHQEVGVRRFLEHPVCQWDYLEDFLKEDLDLLCQSHSFSERHKLVCLEWRLTLHDASILYVPIRFRHPHSLHTELHTHRTALLQANYSFSSAMRAAHRQAMDDTDMFAPPIIGWELVVKEQLVLPPRVSHLFGDDYSDEAALIRLENRLSVNLHHFDLKNDWTPEESFSAFGCDAAPADDVGRPSLSVIARQRPLFLFQKKQPLPKTVSQSSLWQFTERTMYKWWRDDNAQYDGEDKGLARDYYRFVDHKERSLWVCRGEQEKWYVHGIFA